MIPSQIVTGSANPSPLTFSYTKFEDEIYYAYSSGSNVQILKGASLKVIQILTGHKSDVICISWFTQDSKLLTVSGNEIFLYILNNKNNEFYWQKVFILKNSFEITSMSWLNSNSFVVGGNYIAKWKLDIEKIMKVFQNNNNLPVEYGNSYNGMNKVKEQKMIDKQARVTWTIDSSQPIQYLSCSPDGSLFATSSKYDRMIKVWYLQKKHVKKSKLDSDLEELERQQQQQLQQQQFAQQQQKGYYRDQFNKLTNRGNYIPSSTAKKSNDDDDESGNNENKNNGFFSPIQQELISKKIKQKSQQKQKKFELESYGFIYLPHPRSITCISWRHRKTSSQNILLTNCKDGVVRFWQQSYQSRRLQFNVSNIIPSGSCDIVDWVSNLNDEVLQENNDEGANTTTTTTTDQQSNNKQQLNILNNPILLRQKNSLAKTKLIVDWIIGIKSDGSLFLWKLRTDSSNSKQTSSISIWINSQILSNQEIGPNRIIALYQPVSLVDNTPSSIKICFNSFNGAISCRKFFIQHHNHTQISNSSQLTSRCYGHKDLIKEITVSPSSPYLSSIDQNNNVILWQSNDSSKIPSPYFITDIGSFPNFYTSVWSPSKKYCFFSNSEGIIVYSIESNEYIPISSASTSGSTTSSSLSNTLKTLPIYVGFVKGSRLENDYFEQIHIIEPLNSIFIANTPSSIPYEFFILALNKDGDKLMVWGITIKKDTQYSPTGSTSIIKSKLLATKEFERYSRLTCICEAPKGISDGLSNDNRDDKDNNKVVPTQPLAVTGSIEGFISVLGLTPKLKATSSSKGLKDSMDDDEDEFDSDMELDRFDWTISEMATFGAYQHPVETVKPAYFGRFASKAISTVNPNPEIHIWEMESHTPSLKLEDTIILVQSHEEEEKLRKTPVTITMSHQDTVQVNQNSSGSCCFSFMATDDGNCCLAVGMGYQLKVLLKPIDRSIGSYKKPWMEAHSFTDLSAPCKSVQWGKDLSLYATSGNQILVFSKWMKPEQFEHSNPSLINRFLSDSNLDMNPSLYHQQSQISRSLPYYHPKFLSEYMMAGKFDTIEIILNHIFKYLYEEFSKYEDDLDQLPKTTIYIPPISDDILLGKETIKESKVNDNNSEEDDVDRMNNFRKKDIDDDEEDSKQFDIFSDTSNKFTKKKAVKLNEILSSMKLGDLNSNEQIQLLAVTDTYGDIGELRGGLDENGSRFVLVAKIFQFLRRSLSPQDRPISLSTNDILWALHSEAQETILQTTFNSDPDWESLKQIGAGLWIKSPSTLKNMVEKLAKTTFLLKKDPAECSLYYMALKKKGALIALHKAHKNIKQVEFLSQDFTQPKWITAAAKSAFLLQSKHKYEVAASLFILAGQLKQAVNLILQIQGDFQLALVISRLYEGENGEVSKMIIEDHIIPHAKKTNDRSLLSIGYWLLKKYEDAFTILIPSTSIDGGKKLDDNGTLNMGMGSTSPINVSGSSSPNIYSSGFSRSSSASSPKPLTYLAAGTSGSTQTPILQQISNRGAMFSQLRSSDMGPSLLYFFRFLKNHTLLRQLPDSIKKDDQFLRNSAYSYLNSGCNILALNNIVELEKIHPKLLSENELKELKDQERKEKERKEREQKEEEEKKNQQSKSSNSDFDFGGGSSSSRFSSSNNYDMGLDFGGSSSRFSSSNNYDMGLDFGGSSSRFSNNNSDNNSNDMGLDFGGSSSRFSSSNNNNNDMGLDFGSTTTTAPKSSSWDFLDSSSTPSISVTSTNTTTTTTTTTTKAEEKKIERVENEKLSFYSIIDLELKTKSILLILIDRILLLRSSKNNNSYENEIQELFNSIKFYSNEYQFKESTLIDKLTQFCLDRQYIKESVQLLILNQSNPIETLEDICISIIKSISRMDDYKSSTDFRLLQKQLIELYQSIKIINNPTTAALSSPIISVTLYIMILLLGWGNNRYDILILLFNIDSSNNSKPIQSQKSLEELLERINRVPLRYNDESLELEVEVDSDDEDHKKGSVKLYNITNTLERIFDMLVIKKFRYYFDEFLKPIQHNNIDNNNHNVSTVLDLITQRLNYWIGTIQLRLLHIPKEIVDHYQKKPPRSTAIDNLSDYVKSFKYFSSRDRLEIWNSLLYKNEHIENLDKIIFGLDDSHFMNGNNANSGNVINEIILRNSSNSSGRVKFEDEVELYKDNDLLQSFCLDTTSPDLSVLAIATTRGIREINLKQLYENYKDDYDMDSLNTTTETFLSPTQTKKFRVSSKSASTLNISKSGGSINTAGTGSNVNSINNNQSSGTGKGNVFKSAISSLNLTKSVDHNIIVQCLESHPTSSYYLSGGIDGSVCLWQFGIPEVLTAYQLPIGKPRIVKCHFNQSGTKFGAVDMAGNLLLWQFAAQEDTLKPFYTLQAHSKQALDFTFLNSGSLLATAGISLDSKKDVCLWDVLLPPHKSLIASYTDQENGASSIIYSPKQHAIIVGGKKGSLSLYDIRTNKAIDNFKAHQLNTKTLAMDPNEEFLISGSSDGNCKVWSLPSMTCLQTFEDCHKKQTFVRPTGVFKSPVSTYGVMQVGIENNNIFSCGSDGRLLKRKIIK